MIYGALTVDHKSEIKNQIRVVFEHSLWWLLPAILISSAAAFFKYKKLTGLPDIPQGVAVLLSALRFLILLFLSGLILNPALSLLKRTKEKPVLVLAQDNSESLLKNRDSYPTMDSSFIPKKSTNP